MPKPTDALDKVVLLIISGMPAADLPGAVEQLGVSPRRVNRVIAEARERIVAAAHFDREAQLGAAILRLQDIIARALKGGADLKTALSAQKELARMLDLKRPPPTKAGAGGNEELQAIGRHLIPLGLADESWPLREHARLAAEAIRRTNGHKNGKAHAAQEGRR